MPQQIWGFSNTPVNRQVPLGTGQSTILTLNCSGYVVDWARNVLAGESMDRTRPIEGDTSSGVLARAHSALARTGGAQMRLETFYDGALIGRQLQRGETFEFNDIRALFNEIADQAPSRHVYCVHLEGNSQSGDRYSHTIGIYKESGNNLYVFNPDSGLGRCTSRADFLQVAGPYLPL
jgi:hypothetical protein